MTKHDMALQLADRINIQGFGPAAANKAIDQLINIVAECLQRDEAIFLRGFATIKPVLRNARKARDIAAGKVIQLPACNSVRLIPSKALIKRLNP